MLLTIDLADPAIDAATGPAAVLLLAVLQGLTEFLPVSSSGHLLLARLALEVREAGLALDVALHVGTLGAVAWAYRADLGRLVRELASGRPRMLLWLLVATLPIAVAGLSLRAVIAGAAQHSAVAGVGFLVTATVLLAGEAGRRRAEAGNEGRAGGDDPVGRAGGTGGDGRQPDAFGSPSFADAVALGLAQAVAIVPGISRSGTTIAVGLVRGMPAVQAARLSFLMSMPAVAGAALVELPGAFEQGFGDLPSGLVLGAALLAGLVGWAALRTLLLVLSRGALRWFAAYCALLGALTLVFG